MQEHDKGQKISSSSKYHIRAGRMIRAGSGTVRKFPVYRHFFTTLHAAVFPENKYENAGKTVCLLQSPSHPYLP
jgi:hypothetical protein